VTRPSLDVDELAPAAPEESWGFAAGSQRSLSKNDVRTYAIRVLNVIADLTPGERARVLEHAAAVNDV